MKDQYVGDVKDFFKYGLLRALDGCGLPQIMCWMLTGPDGTTQGLKIDYLRDPRFRRFDPPLYDSMKSIVESGDRRLTAIEESGLLTATFAPKVRDLWAIGPLPSLIFFDPDMGFEVKSVRRGSARADQYLFWADAKELFGRGHSLLVFQHWQRKRWEAVLPLIAERAEAEFGTVSVRGLLTRHGVAFVLLSQATHGDLDQRTVEFVERWAPEVELWTAS